MTLFRDNFPQIDESLPHESIGTPTRKKSKPAPRPVPHLRRSDLQQKDDPELVELVRQGEKRAFDILVQRHQQMVVSTLLRMMDIADAQDVAQETFIKAYRSIASFRGDSQFATWLYRIASNTAMNHLKLRRRRSGAVHLDALDNDKSIHVDGMVDHASPEAQLMADELQQVLESRLKRMKPDLREAITCYELEGMSYQEIAERMDCPVGTIRSRISRSREIINGGLRLHGYDPLTPDAG